MAQKCIRQEDPPDPRVSTVTPATISFFKGRIIPEVVVMLNFYIACLWLFQLLSWYHCSKQKIEGECHPSLAISGVVQYFSVCQIFLLFIRKLLFPLKLLSSHTPIPLTEYDTWCFIGMGAWKYVEQHRHAFFDRMQVKVLFIYLYTEIFSLFSKMQKTILKEFCCFKKIINIYYEHMRLLCVFLNQVLWVRNILFTIDRELVNLIVL